MGGIAAFRLGEWRVEPAANLLTRGEDELRVELKVMEVLLCLADHAGEVVPNRDLTSAGDDQDRGRCAFGMTFFGETNGE